MPRKSSAEIAMLNVYNPAIDTPPPPPPDHLAPPAAAIWREVVRERPRSFSAYGSQVLLACYCCHAASERMISEQIGKIEASPEGSPLLDKLLMLRARESQSMARLAIRLKLVPGKTEEVLPPSLPWQDGRSQ